MGNKVQAAQLPRVVHVSSAHPWTDNRIHYRECASLVEEGYDVSLVALESKVDGPDVGVTLIKLPRTGRASRVVLGTIRAVRSALKTRARIVHLHDPELAWAIPILRLLGKTVIYDAHEDLPIQVKNKPYLRRAVVPLVVMAAHIIVGLTRLSSHVVAATETIARRYGSPRVSVVRNYPPLRIEEMQAPDVSARELAVAYIGSISPLRGAGVMIESLAHPDFPSNWRLNLAGSISPDLAEVLAQAPGWTQTDFRGQLSSPDARDLLLHSRVGLVLLQDTQAYRDSLPTKMFEYFAAGLPVIASDFPLWRTIVAERDCGILVDERSPAAVAAAVRRYADEPDLLRRHSANARRLAEEELNWSHEAQELLRVYAELSG